MTNLQARKRVMIMPPIARIDELKKRLKNTPTPLKSQRDKLRQEIQRLEGRQDNIQPVDASKPTAQGNPPTETKASAKVKSPLNPADNNKVDDISKAAPSPLYHENVNIPGNVERLSSMNPNDVKNPQKGSVYFAPNNRYYRYESGGVYTPVEQQGDSDTFLSEQDKRKIEFDNRMSKLSELNRDRYFQERQDTLGMNTSDQRAHLHNFYGQLISGQENAHRLNMQRRIKEGIPINVNSISDIESPSVGANYKFSNGSTYRFSKDGNYHRVVYNAHDDKYVVPEEVESPFSKGAKETYEKGIFNKDVIGSAPYFNDRLNKRLSSLQDTFSSVYDTLNASWNNSSTKNKKRAVDTTNRVYKKFVDMRKDAIQRAKSRYKQSQVEANTTQPSLSDEAKDYLLSSDGKKDIETTMAKLASENGGSPEDYHQKAVGDVYKNHIKYLKHINSLGNEDMNSHDDIIKNIMGGDESNFSDKDINLGIDNVDYSKLNIPSLDLSYKPDNNDNNGKITFTPIK